MAAHLFCLKKNGPCPGPSLTWGGRATDCNRGLRSGLGVGRRFSRPKPLENDPCAVPLGRVGREGAPSHASCLVFAPLWFVCCFCCAGRDFSARISDSAFRSSQNMPHRSRLMLRCKSVTCLAAACRLEPPLFNRSFSLACLQQLALQELLQPACGCLSRPPTHPQCSCTRDYPATTGHHPITLAA